MKIKRVDLKLGFKCNNFCRFCIQRKKRNQSGKSPEEVKKILEKEKDECTDVVFTGGEPTIYQNLPHYVSYARELGYETVQIQTNGRMFYSLDYCKRLIDAGANIFNPALHGASQETHDFLTRSPGSFEQVLEGIKNLKELDQTIFVNTVVTKNNHHELTDIARLLADIKPDLFQFAFIHINSVIKNDVNLIEEIVPRYKNVVPEIKRAIDIGKKAGIKVETEAIPYCFMLGYEDHLAEIGCPDANVYDADKVLKDFNKFRAKEGKSKGEKCKKCRFFKDCEGVWNEYPEIFGWEEFNPVEE